MKGNIFCWLSSDDIWKPNKLEVQNKVAEKYPESIIYSSYDSFSKENSYLNTMGIDIRGGNYARASLKGCFMNFSTAWIPKTIINRVGMFNEEFRFSEDYEWLIRAAAEHKSDFKFINESLVKRRLHYKQVTINHSKSLASEYNEKIKRLKYKYM